MFYNMRNSYVLTRDVFYVAYHMLMHFSCIHTFIPLFFWYWSVLVLFCLFLSLSFFWLVALWHLNGNPLRPRTHFILGHLPLILPSPMSDFVMRRPSRTSRRTFHDAAFIWKAKSLIPPWSYMSFTTICTDSILQYLILSLTFEVHTL